MLRNVPAVVVSRLLLLLSSVGFWSLFVSRGPAAFVSAAWDRVARSLAGRSDIVRVWDGSRFVGVPWPVQEPSVPYAVHLFDERGRARVLVFDFDAHSGDVGQASDDVAQVCLLLSLAGARFVRVRSSAAGGFHVFVPFSARVSAAAAKAIGVALAGRCSTLDVSMLANQRTGAIRPPGAPHRDGSRSVPLDDVAPFDDPNPPEVLAALLDLLGLAPYLSRNRPPLSPRLYAMLHTGAGVDRYVSMSEAVMALAVSVVSRGYDPGWLRAELLSGSHELSRRLVEHRRRDGSRRDGSRLVEGSIAKALAFVAARPPLTGPDDAHRVLDEIEQVAASRRWVNVAGLTDASVLAAHVAIARRCGSVVHAASQRQLCEQAGLGSRATVERAHRRLVAAGFLALERQSDGTNATIWRLRCPPSGVAPKLGFDYLTHDVFTWAGLGKAAARVLACVEAGVVQVAAVAARTGLHPGSVRRSARRLVDAGVLVEDRGWLRIAAGAAGPVRVSSQGPEQLSGRQQRACQTVEQDGLLAGQFDAPGRRPVDVGVLLDEVAVLLGLAQRRAALEVRHERERQGWQRFLAAVRAGVGPPRRVRCVAA